MLDLIIFEVCVGATISRVFYLYALIKIVVTYMLLKNSDAHVYPRVNFSLPLYLYKRNGH